MTKQEILNRLKEGASEVLSVVYKQYREEFINWSVSTYSLDSDDAKDIYQTTIIIFYENILMKKLPSLNSSIKTYLFAIGKNKIREKLRESGKMFPSNDVLNEAFTYKEETVDTEKEPLYNTFRLCLDELGNPCKSVLISFYYKNFTMQEIAQVFNYKNEATAKNSKYKCLQRLKDCVFAKTGTAQP